MAASSAYQKKEERLEFLLAFLRDYYEERDWESDESDESDEEEGEFFDFYAKIKLQQEILQILSGKVKLKDIEEASKTFALKTKYPIGRL